MDKGNGSSPYTYYCTISTKSSRGCDRDRKTQKVHEFTFDKSGNVPQLDVGFFLFGRLADHQRPAVTWDRQSKNLFKFTVIVTRDWTLGQNSTVSLLSLPISLLLSVSMQTFVLALCLGQCNCCNTSLPRPKSLWSFICSCTQPK